MPLTIDLEKCLKDGLCAQVCPRKLISLAEDKTPSAIPEAAETCIDCGQCLAVCPGSAISVAGIGPEDCPPLAETPLPSLDQTAGLIRARRSIRAFKEKPLTKPEIERLLDICRYSPTGSNSQSVNWILVDDPGRKRALAQLVIDWMASMVQAQDPIAERMNLPVVVQAWAEGQDRIFRGAPLVALTHAHEEASMASANCIIALGYLELIAYSMGLGSCWIGYMMLAASRSPEIREALGLDPAHHVFGAMVVGYPKPKYLRIPPRNEAQVAFF